ncbi:hypothetical protein ES705_48332 [subsurface metagenome]
MFLIHYDKTQVFNRCKNSTSRPNYQAHLTVKHPVPLFESLRRCQPGVKHPYPAAKNSTEFFIDLVGQ